MTATEIEVLEGITFNGENLEVHEFWLHACCDPEFCHLDGGARCARKGGDLVAEVRTASGAMVNSEGLWTDYSFVGH